MLRMRKKPPADRPNINSGKPWSGMRALEKDRDHDGQADQEQGCSEQFSWWSGHD